MPGFNLSSYPGDNEEPIGLFKPRYDAFEGLWSPMAYTTIFAGPNLGVGLFWLNEYLFEASVLPNGHLLYTSGVSTSGHQMRVEIGYDLPDPVRPDLEPFWEVEMTPAAGSGLPDPLTFSRTSPVVATRTGVSREFFYDSNFSCDEPSICISDLQIFPMRLRMIDPVEPIETEQEVQRDDCP